MKLTKILALLLSALVATTLVNCGGGGGDGSDSASGGGAGSGSGDIWEAQASVTSDTCGERISDVKQRFSIDGSQINTGITTLNTQDSGSGFTFGFSESNGDCTRTYEGTFSNISGSTADVNFTATSACSSSNCSSTWTGTATKIN